MLFPNKLTAVLFSVVIICSGTLIFRNHRLDLTNAWTQGRTLLATMVGVSDTTPWPPKIDLPYPGVNMIDQDGKITSIEEFRGKVVLIELIGMSFPGCVALSGGGLYGGYGETMPQDEISSIDEYVERFSGTSLDHSDIVLVQILISDPNLQPTDADDAQTWAYQFRHTREHQRVVLAGSQALFEAESVNLVPGSFHLLDRNLILRASSSGREPPHRLYDQLIPLIPELLDLKAE
jgi:hypothetical protein